MSTSANVFIFDLGSDLKLRVNDRSDKSNGSILLKTADGLFECVECKQQFETRYTGDNWWHEIHTSAKSEKDGAKELAWYKEHNATPVVFKDLRESGKTSVNVAECDLLSREFPAELNVIKSSVWNQDDGILELSTEKSIEKKAWNTYETNTTYCNMLLFFHAVDFGKGISAANKRARN